MSDRTEYIIKVVEAEADLDWGSCFYEGDIPTAELKLSIKDMTLEELLGSLNVHQLKANGLQRIPEKAKKTKS